jgi:hypothetical protein
VPLLLLLSLMGTRPVQDGSNATVLQDAHVQEDPGADGASLGIVNVEVDGAGPQPGDDVGGPLHNLVVHGAGLGTPVSTTPGTVILALESLGAKGPGTAELFLPGSPGSPSLPIDWGRQRTMWSSCVHRSPSQRGCCERHWSQSAGTSYIQFGLV